MSATNSHLQLEGYFLKELNYSIRDEMEEFPQKRESLKSINLEVFDSTRALGDNNQRWRSELIVKSEDDDTYDFKIVMVGFFTVNPDLDDAIKAVLAESNCPAVLYSTAREIIATVTRRSPFPAMLLPLVTFVKSPEKSKEAVPPKKDKKSKPAQSKSKNASGSKTP